nr:hypothetical protein [Acetobacter persici]
MSKKIKYVRDVRMLSTEFVANTIKEEVRKNFPFEDIRVIYYNDKSIFIGLFYSGKRPYSVYYSLRSSYTHLSGAVYGSVDIGFTGQLELIHYRYFWLTPDNKILSAFSKLDENEEIDNIEKPDPSYELVKIDCYRTSVHGSKK